MENMFEKGCLVQLSAAVWGASTKGQYRANSPMMSVRKMVERTRRSWSIPTH